MCNELDRPATNSGGYLQQRYEIPILASFRVSWARTIAASFMRSSRQQSTCAPAVNLADLSHGFPRHRPKPGRCTVKLNRVLLRDDVENKCSTPGVLPKNPDPARIYRQDHGEPVLFKNRWRVEQ